MEIPRLGLSRSYSCQPIPQAQQLRVGAVSVTYTTAHDNARPGIEPASSWILVRFVSTEPQCAFCIGHVLNYHLRV